MSKPVILCVDDEKIVLDSLQEQLNREFGDLYQIEIAESGEEGLEIIQELIGENIRVAVLISDQLMPSMKGDQLLIEAHKIIPDSAKLLLTGQAEQEAIQKAREEGGLQFYIDKPWDKDILIGNIKKCLE